MYAKTNLFKVTPGRPDEDFSMAKGYKRKSNMKFDSLIFDLDGTLWDAGDIYAQAWNQSLKAMKSNKVINREMLLPLMGMEQGEALAKLIPEYEEGERNKINNDVIARINRMIPEAGGHLYEDVTEGIEKLSRFYKLFILSNCPKGLIENFLEWSRLKPYITDKIAYGDNLQPKAQNIEYLVKKHGLKNPAYIGDTDSDRLQSEKAGVPFIFVSYGFGDCDAYHLKFDSFSELTAFLLNSL